MEDPTGEDFQHHGMYYLNQPRSLGAASRSFEGHSILTAHPV